MENRRGWTTYEEMPRDGRWHYCHCRPHAKDRAATWISYLLPARRYFVILCEDCYDRFGWNR